jgi:hypothetical protein
MAKYIGGIARNLDISEVVNSFLPGPGNQSSQMDQMSDDQILDTIKSRHLQSPSELLAWSEYLIDQAKSIEDEASRIALEKEQRISNLNQEILQEQPKD